MTETPPLERKLVAILAADVVGYSRLMHDDEERTLATLTAHRASHRRADRQRPRPDRRHCRRQRACGIPERRRRIALRRRHPAGAGQGQRPLPAKAQMLFRIGINVGDVMVKDGDIFGDGVNVAARLEGIAEPGGICVTRGVRDHLRDRMEYEFEDLGEHRVKNISRPVRVFRVGFDPDATTELTPSERLPPSAEDRPGKPQCRQRRTRRACFLAIGRGERRSQGIPGLSRTISGRRVRHAG